MAIPLVSGHVPLLWPADWRAAKPRWRKEFALASAPALRGNELRLGLRGSPRYSMEWAVHPRTAGDRERFTAYLRAALASGKACAPKLGEALWLLTGASGGNTITFDSVREVTAGNYVWVARPDRLPAEDPLDDLYLVDAAAPGSLTTTAPLTRTYAAETPIYRLLFGKLDGPINWQAVTAERAAVPLSLLMDAPAPALPATF